MESFEYNFMIGDVVHMKHDPNVKMLVVDNEDRWNNVCCQWFCKNNVLMTAVVKSKCLVLTNPYETNGIK